MTDNTQIAPAATQPVSAESTNTTAAARRPAITPAVDIVEDAHGITLWADLPGVTRDSLEVRMQDGLLSIEAEASVPVAAGLRVQYTELQQPRFSRAFNVSPDFDTARIDAQLQNGVLTLLIPRREEAKPRRIEVRVA
ncbi:Hsp20/alpha crystallin family protein [Cupriavidus plantarum]|uniref:HSP20 family molecular chaperone IbpA n=1 Tax=Cupriavidus plantarum TaxID=942865 RepID=A0A316EJ40_9BURK|nr:Hsp20/alpha crystallin family protein [Cupriavidus plantarum]NYI02340.1 HSP20 family molecular chaperone IbpA [Cupriavidus plantarum]PWK31545.1 HSP20 family molecular chaperone IbpA [Cupriavidus plantarum]REE85514.1 HSP20 family molecular chaperone IbpA [Cupriavidus plantarum]CAG2146080.1 hypothetical protein LMG26296_03875 [Cupriavidus plantarum]SMR86637.1 Molecular chaperone IbpA, HSP20 family [Cupriavidus plantarum]